MTDTKFVWAVFDYISTSGEALDSIWSTQELAEQHAGKGKVVRFTLDSGGWEGNEE